MRTNSRAVEVSGAAEDGEGMEWRVSSWVGALRDIVLLSLVSALVIWSLNREERKSSFDREHALSRVAQRTFAVFDAAPRASLFERILLSANGINVERNRRDAVVWIEEFMREHPASCLRFYQGAATNDPACSTARLPPQEADRLLRKLCLLHALNVLILLLGALAAYLIIATRNMSGATRRSGNLSAIFLVTALTLFGQTLLQWGLQRSGYPVHWTDWYNETLVFGKSTAIRLLLVANCIVTPVMEEILFRGIVYSILRRRIGILGALVASSLLFGISHGAGLPTFLSLTWCGAVWAVSYERTKSLVPGVVAHALNNGLYNLSVVLFLR